MSNNIYDILKKFNNLDSVKNILNEGKTVCKSCGKAKCKCVDESKGSKPDFLDMDKDGDTKEPMKKATREKSKGAVAEAVAQVEKQLNEKYMGFKKTAAAVAKGGSAKDPEAVAAAIGRKKYGKEKFQKAAAAGKKMGEELDPNLKTPNWDAHNQRMMDPSIKSFSDQQDANSRSSAAMGAYSADERGQKAYKDRTAPGIINKVKDFVGYDKPNPAYGPKDMKEADANEDMLLPGQKKIARMSPPSDKIDANDLAALRAGKKKKAEGNEFSGELAKAKAQHKDKFNVGGKTYPVKEGFPTVADAKKRMDDREGKTAHGKKTITKTGTKHERDYDAVDRGADVDMTPKGRGRPKKDRFA
jgi:hypothetical protein